jgi:hypothetical protein
MLGNDDTSLLFSLLLVLLEDEPLEDEEELLEDETLEDEEELLEGFCLAFVDVFFFFHLATKDL